VPKVEETVHGAGRTEKNKKRFTVQGSGLTEKLQQHYQTGFTILPEFLLIGRGG